MDEKALVRSLQDGDAGAFETLVRLHHRAVYNMAFRYMGDHGGADDVVQETFVKAFNAIQSFRGESSFKSWLIRIAVNTAKNSLRSRERHAAVDIADLPLSSKHHDFTRLEGLQTAELLRLAIARLAPKQREALELRVYEDLSFKEIAEIMDCPFDTAKANYRHAVLNLRKILERADSPARLEELRQAFESLGEDEEEHGIG
jgi:RNA polymerase sigma-70 factor (ECF subfamily)